MAAKVFLVLIFKDNDITMTQSVLKQTLTPAHIDVKTAGVGETLVGKPFFYSGSSFRVPSRLEPPTGHCLLTFAFLHVLNPES